DNMDKRLDNMDKRLDNMDKRLDAMDERLDGMDRRLDRIEADIVEIKENAEITRAAVNYNGERLDNLIQELKANQIIA
ncbi:MAG: hypothetical protein J6Y81_15865, partial [Ruminococcus sp.]|nr:hypothetical protein [Ruminococcus sp.]